MMIGSSLVATVAVWENVTTRPARQVLAFNGEARAETWVEGGHGLRAFTLSLWVRSSVGCVEGPRVAYEAGGHWYLAGCMLANAIVSRTAPATWRPAWRARRRCCAVSPEFDLRSPGGGRKEARDARAAIRAALWGGARSDFGLALLPNGRGLAFGVGHRDFEGFSVGRPVGDFTLEANSSSSLLDDTWHHVVAVRGASLDLYVDGRRLEGASRGVDAAGIHELHDAAHFVALGQLYRGCLFDVALHRRAWSSQEVSTAYRHRPSLPGPCDGVPRGVVESYAEIEGRRVVPEPTPLYFLAHSDSGSVAMRDSFLASIRDSRHLIEPRQVSGTSALGATQKQRYGPKGDLILQALAENPPGSVVLVSDLDIRFFRPIANIVDVYAKMRNADVVFQRDDDWSLAANLGFMALRCTPAVSEFFRIVADMAMRYARGDRDPRVVGGDQRIVNVALRDPARVPDLPELEWALFPTELMTRAIDQQRGMLYKWVLVSRSERITTPRLSFLRHEEFDVMYHVNDFGSDRISPNKARITKMALLDAAEKRHVAAALGRRRSSVGGGGGNRSFLRVLSR
ncbi:hypothetical protein CTAYLR_005922 [Chrysophaeum taylorii]|uniref:Nucleotide-diphospho-sugar transferase domain-containing protein n=1 Tax=Chrysophaeum taylorii TaxID=2483200 RepID=A0AAD7UAT6_9STRA|nr:hypothetical protein CTAYLR_005922 [Chrysophaeum taylorii]